MPFTVLRQAPLLLEFDELVIVKIYSTNSIGAGPECLPNTGGVKIQTEPVAPSNPPSIVSYSEYSVQLTIETLTSEQLRGSAVLYYDLAWDMGTGGVSWESYSIMTESYGETLIYTTINGLDSGVEYQFNYRAQNIHGWSTEYSPSVTVKTLKEPEAIGAPTTTNSGDQVTIKWLAPYTGGSGIAITSYEI